MSDDGLTGPIQITDEEKEKWYHRFKDFCNPIQQRGYGIICHPDWKQLLVDMLERLKEDETWPHDGVPPLAVSSRMHRADIQPFDLNENLPKTMAQVNKAPTGFGRYRGLLIPRKEGLHNPWKK